MKIPLEVYLQTKLTWWMAWNMIICLYFYIYISRKYSLNWCIPYLKKHSVSCLPDFKSQDSACRRALQTYSVFQLGFFFFVQMSYIPCDRRSLWYPFKKKKIQIRNKMNETHCNVLLLEKMWMVISYNLFYSFHPGLHCCVTASSSILISGYSQFFCVHVGFPWFSGFLHITV